MAEPIRKRVIIIIGATNTGKTTEAKKVAKATGLPYFIDDPNKQYLELPNSAKGMPIKDILEAAMKKEDTCIIFDEATVHFKDPVPKELLYFLAGKRHAGKLGNVIILNFHSIRKMPLDILDFTNYIILHKTNDVQKNVKMRFGSDWGGIYENYLELQAEKDFHAKRYIKISD